MVLYEGHKQQTNLQAVSKAVHNTVEMSVPRRVSFHVFPHS